MYSFTIHVANNKKLNTRHNVLNKLYLVNKQNNKSSVL